MMRFSSIVVFVLYESNGKIFLVGLVFSMLLGFEGKILDEFCELLNVLDGGGAI